MKKLADRINSIEESKSIGLSATLSDLRDRGEKIIGLNVGEPEFATPPQIIEATKKALDENKTRYSLVQGISELRLAIVKKLRKENDLDVTEKNVIIGNGSKQILYNIFQTMINPGDEVIIPAPYWVTFPESVKLAGGIPIIVNTKNHQLDLINIKNAITSKTKMIIINTPNNPTGAVYPEEDLRKLAEICVKKDIYIVSDEAYERLVFDQKHVSIASFGPEIFQRTLTVQTFSKSHCMTGFRLGYLVADELIINAINKLQSHLTGNNCTFSQYGAIEALQMDSSIIDGMIDIMKKRRDLAFNLAKDIFKVIQPSGAMYLFPNVDEFMGERFINDIEMANYILEKAKVAVLPGSAFGQPNHLRICFAAHEDDIKEGLRKIKEVLS